MFHSQVPQGPVSISVFGLRSQVSADAAACAVIWKKMGRNKFLPNF